MLPLIVFKTFLLHIWLSTFTGPHTWLSNLWNKDDKKHSDIVRHEDRPILLFIMFIRPSHLLLGSLGWSNMKFYDCWYYTRRVFYVTCFVILLSIEWSDGFWLRSQMCNKSPQSRGGRYCHHHVWPCGRAFAFLFRMISRKPLAGSFSYCIHISLRGCRCAFWGLRPLT